MHQIKSQMYTKYFGKAPHKSYRRLATMGSATTRPSPTTRRARTTPISWTWRMPGRPMSRRRSSSKSGKMKRCRHFCIYTILVLTITILTSLTFAIHHLHFQQAQPNMCHSHKVENGVKHFLFYFLFLNQYSNFIILFLNHFFYFELS